MHPTLGSAGQRGLRSSPGARRRGAGVRRWRSARGSQPFFLTRRGHGQRTQATTCVRPPPRRVRPCA